MCLMQTNKISAIQGGDVHGLSERAIPNVSYHD